MQHAERSAPWWQVFVDEIDKLPLSQQTDRLAKLALMLVARRHRKAAAAIALRAWRQEQKAGGGAESHIVQRALRAATAGYHVSISTDAQRIAAWQASLGDVVKPGMLALEIGAGSGILAMLAARAGAQVVSCEKDAILAAIAEATVSRNGLGERIRIVAKAGADLRVPHDMPRPAELLLLDLFANRLFDFDPFGAIRSVSHLLGPNVVVVPSRVSLEAALVEFRQWDRVIPGDVAGLDLAPLQALSPMLSRMEAADPDLVTRSTSETMVVAILPHDMPAASGVSERILTSNGGRVNGIVFWLRLELAPGHVLEARPGQTPRGFYAQPSFFALRNQTETLPGQQCAVRIGWQDKVLMVDYADWRS
jgi:type III protein arginine methyltransferase